MDIRIESKTPAEAQTLVQMIADGTASVGLVLLGTDTYVCMLADVVDTASGMGFTDRFNIAVPYTLTATQLSIAEVQCSSSVLGTVECGHVGD